MIFEIVRTAYYPPDFQTLYERKLTPRRKYLGKYPSFDSIPPGYKTKSDYMRPGEIYKITIKTLYERSRKRENVIDTLAYLSEKFKNDFKLDYNYYNPVVNQAREYYFYAIKRNISLRDYGVNNYKKRTV